MVNGKRIGLGIVAFDACEHLINIISELEGLLDYVVIGLQKVSYHGKPIAKEDLYFCEKLVNDKLADKIIYIETDLSKFARHQEVDKRNLMLDDIQNEGKCDYSFIIDSDEFYKRSQFEKCVNKIIENDYDLTYCQYVNYFGDYRHYLVYPFKNGCFVPFLAKSDYRYTWNCQDWDKPSDPTRRWVRKRDKSNIFCDICHEFTWKELNMHHLSWIRRNISAKLDNWSAKKMFENYPFLSDKSIETFNQFINGDPSQKCIQEATLLFNTPNNKVTIAEWPKQYINPKYDIYNLEIPEDILVNENYNICLLVDLDFKDINQKPEEIYERYNNTYTKDIKVFFYTGRDKNFATGKEDVIYIGGLPVQNNNKYAYTKLSKSLEWLLNGNSGKMYDYVIKIDPDVWVNLDYIKYAISHQMLDRRSLYGSHKLKSFQTKWALYVSDEAMILSDIAIQKIVTTYNNSIENQAPNNPDVLIGAILNTEYNKVKLEDIESKWKSVGIKYGFKDMDNKANDQYGYFFVKCLWGDLNTVWKELEDNKPEFNESTDKEKIIDKLNNNQCLNIKETKEEWIKEKLDSYRKSEIYNNMLLFGQAEHPRI